MASSFTFLQAALADPRTACFYARRTLELAVEWLFQAEVGRSGALEWRECLAQGNGRTTG